jgi:hypothetical protein
MNQSMKYRQNAAECYEAARVLSDHREKAKMLAVMDNAGCPIIMATRRYS